MTILHTFPCMRIQWCSKFRKIRNKFAIIRKNTKCATKLTKRGWQRQFCDSFRFLFVRNHAIFLKDHTEEWNLFECDLQLRRFDLDSVLMQTIKDFLNIAQMVVDVVSLRVNQAI